MNILIRLEQSDDYRTVEEITRRAFWNLHVPGCDEHYLAHVMREHQDFIKALDFVMEVNNKLIGNIMYTKSKIISKKGQEKDILTFGPVSIEPRYQRKGYGKKLIEHSFSKALELGYDLIVIFGNPCNYVSLGFQSCRKYNISIGNEIYPTGMLVKELKSVKLGEEEWIYKESEVYSIDKKKAEVFDLGFEKLEKQKCPSQEEFYILSNSRIINNSI